MCVASLFAAQALLGVTWGLPSRSIDKYLFPEGDVWTGEKIYRLANAGAKFDPSRGADVDADPLRNGNDDPIPLTATEEDVAKILLRYRLYTHQPDEMIAMMALAGMNPSRLDFDPRLYQYGGLFIYPVGGLIKLCGILGLIDVRSDVVYYLDHPNEFGNFYVVARLYSAAWGLFGVLVVYAIAKRIAIFRTPSASAGSVATDADQRSSHRAALLAATLFALMPVVVCMSHEGKPHLPGAVLMLIAVYFALRCSIRTRSASDGPDPLPYGRGSDAARAFRWMSAACGASVGMVLSSWPICVLIPLVAFRAVGASPRAKVVRILSGGALAIGVYLLTNPYVLINAFTNREVLRSNFGNSLAMYEVARLGEGFVRVLELTVEGATLPIVALGLVGIVLAVRRGNRAILPLLAVAAVFFLQFILIGAGKPAEYGRFGVFTNTTLAIGCAALIGITTRSRHARSARAIAAMFVVVWTAVFAAGYLHNFQLDATSANSRNQLAASITGWSREFRHTGVPLDIALIAEPAPYNCPPIPFGSTKVLLVRSPLDAIHKLTHPFWRLVHPSESGTSPGREPERPRLQEFLSDGGAWWATPISWANKPFFSENTANFVPNP